MPTSPPRTGPKSIASRRPGAEPLEKYGARAASPRSWEQTSGENTRYDHHADADCYVIAGDQGSLEVPTMLSPMRSTITASYARTCCHFTSRSAVVMFAGTWREFHASCGTLLQEKTNGSPENFCRTWTLQV